MSRVSHQPSRKSSRTNSFKRRRRRKGGHVRNQTLNQRRLALESLEPRRVLSSIVELISAADPDLPSLTANASSDQQRVSDDGRFVVFTSDADNLVPGDDNSSRDVFLRDRELDTTTLISRSMDGSGSGNSDSLYPVISGDGSTVAFQSDASNLDAQDTDTGLDVYLWTASDGVQLVSVNADGSGSGNGYSLNPVISGDGSTVAFQSYASNLDAQDTDTGLDVYLWTASDGVQLLSINTDGTDSGNSNSQLPAISADGSTVAFQSYANNLDARDTDSDGDLYVWNETDGVQLISVDTNGIGSGNGPSQRPVISADGSSVAFQSYANNLDARDTDNSWDVYLWNMTDGVQLLSVNMDGTGSGNGYSQLPVISADGSTVAFQSYANNLDARDADSTADIYAWTATDGVQLVSVNTDGTGSGSSNSDSLVISRDGSTVAFRSFASNLDSQDTDTMADIYAWTATDGVQLVSVNTDGTGSGNSYSQFPVINSDGSIVVFESAASNLVESHNNDATDVFAAFLNSPPIAQSGGPYTIEEGQDLPLDATGSYDPDTAHGDAVASYKWDLNGDGLYDISSAEPQVLVSWQDLTAVGIDDGPSSHDVTLRVTDTYGATDEAVSGLTVTNAAPIVDAGADQTVNEGATVSIAPSFTDAAAEDTHTATIDWGDGSTELIDPATSPLSATHAYNDDGIYNVEVTVTDDDGAATTDAVDITVDPARTEVTLVDGILSITDVEGGNSDDHLTIIHSDGNYTITDAVLIIDASSMPGSSGNGTTSVVVPDADVTGISVNTLGGDDTLILDFGGTSFGVPITYNGGDAAETDGDVLELHGGATFANVDHVLESSSSGTVNVAGNAAITYTGVEPIQDNLSATARTFEFTGAQEEITLSDDATSGNNKSVINSTLGESVTFTVPTDGLTIDTTVGTGADSIHAEGLDATFDADLTILGDGDDAISFQTAPTDIGSGKLQATAAAIEVAARISSGGSVTLTADKMNLQDNITAANVYLLPNQAGQAIDLGSATDTAADTLELSDAELDRITTGTLRVGDANTGPITITSEISPAGTDVLHLTSGAAVTETAPGLTVANLAVEAGDNVQLFSNNSVETVAIHAPTATAELRNNGDLSVGTVDGIVGIVVGDGQTRLNVFDGDLTIQDTTAPVDIDSQGVVAFYLPTSEAQLNVETGAHVRTRRAGPNYITADHMDWSGTMDNGPGWVRLRPTQDSWGVNLGSTTDTAIDALELSDAELDRITAATLRVGDANVGPITITSEISPAGTDTLHLTSGTTISQSTGPSAELFVSNLAVTASGEIALTRLRNDFDRLAAVSTAGNVMVWDANDVIVGTVDGVSGVDSQQGYVMLGAEDGNLVVQDTPVVADIGAASSVSVTVRGEDAMFSLAPGANVAGDQLVARADNMDLQGTIDCPYSVLLAPSTVGRAIDLGSTANTTANTLELSDAELGNLISERLHIGDIHAGDISITGDIDPASAHMLHLTTGGAVTQTASLSVANLAVEAGDAVMLTNSANDVNTLAAHSISNKVDYFDANGFAVDTVYSTELGGISAGSGPVLLSASSGDVVIEPLAGAPAVEATGSISIYAIGEGNQLTVASGATLQSGASQDLRADRIDLQGSVEAGSNAARLRPSTAAWSIDLGSTANTAANTLELCDAELDRITAGTLRIGTSSSGAIDITDGISPAGTDTLHLTTGSGVEQSVGVSVGRLAVTAEGDVRLGHSGNDTDTVAIHSSGGDAIFSDSGGFTVGTVDGVQGMVSGGDGGLLISSNGDVTISDTGAAADVLGATAVNVQLRGEEAVFRVASGAAVEAAGANVAIRADKMELAGSVTATNQHVILNSLHDGKAIDLGSTGDSAPNTLELSDAELDRVTAGNLVVGSSTAGPIAITAPISPAGAVGFALRSGDGLSQADASSSITHPLVGIDVGGAVELHRSANDVERLAIETQSGDVLFRDINGFEVSSVVVAEGISTATGAVRLSADSGDIRIGDAASGDDVQATAGFSACVEGNDATFEIASGAVVTSSGGNSAITADKINLYGELTAASDLHLRPFETGQPIVLGENLGQADTLELSDAELDRVTAGNLVVGSSTAGPIDITAPISPAGAVGFALRSGDGLSQADTGSSITHPFVGIDVGGAVELHRSANDVERLAIETQSGDVLFRDINGFEVSGVAVAQGISTAAGAVRLSADSGDIRIRNAASGDDVEATDGFSAHLHGDEATFELASGAAVTSGGGVSAITADKITLGGTLMTGVTGEVSVTARRNMELTSEAAISSEQGSISLTANSEGNASGNFIGIEMQGASISSEQGDISVWGQGGDTGTGNHGVHMGSGASIVSSGEGTEAATIDVVGHGGPAADRNYGVYLRGPDVALQSVDGDVNVHGVGGAGNDVLNLGVFVFLGAQIECSGTGGIGITGQGGGVNTSANHGVSIGGTNTGAHVVDGNITLSGAGAGSSALGVTIDGGAFLRADGTGDIDVAGATEPSGVVAISLGDSTVATHVGHVSLQADSMLIDSTAELIAGDGSGVLNVRPDSAGRGIVLGESRDSTRLALSDAELGRVTAGTLRIGTSSSGAIDITDVISPGGTDTLHLTSGDEVSQSLAGQLHVANLAVEAVGSVGLSSGGDRVDTVAIAGSSGQFTNDIGFTVGEVDGVIGIEGINLLRAMTGDLVISDTSAEQDVRNSEGTGTFGVRVVGEDGTLVLAPGARIARNNGQGYYADKMELQGTIDCPYSVLLAPSTAGRAIDLGSVTDTAAGTLELSDAELDRITAGTLRVGNTDSGSITVTSEVSPTNAEILHLTTGGEINDGADGAIVASNLAIESVGPVVLNNATADSGNSVEVLAAEVTGAGNGLHFENSGPLGIGSVDGVSGISTNGGGITIITHSPLTVHERVADTAGGDIRLVASNDGGEDDNLTINASIEATGGDGSIILEAGTDLAINDSGNNAISTSGAGALSGNVARTVQLDIGVPIQSESGEITFAAQNARVRGTDGDDELGFTGTTDGKIGLTSGGDPVATLVLPTSGQIEASGGQGDDTITVDSTIENPATLSGGEGHDVLEGGGGENTLDGGDGNDQLIGGTGTNTLIGGEGDDTIEDGGGTNTVIGGSGSNTFVPGEGTNTFETEAGSTVPEVYADTYSIPEDDKLTVSPDQGVLANDLDPEGRSLSAEAITSAAHGTVSLADNGSFTYSPSANFNGTDTFTYQAFNETQYSSEATVTIQVAPVNDAPVAATASLETDEDLPVDVDLRTLVSDVETEDDDLLFAVGGAVHGSVALMEDGYTARFTPNLDFPSPKATGEADFTYDVTDTGDPADTPANTITVSETRINVTVRNLVDLSGRVFNDRNNDGVFDDSQDVPLEGVDIQVWDDTMTRMFASDETESDGTYLLDANLAGGTYQLVEIYDDNPESASFEGLLDGKETAGSLGGDVVNDADSNVIANISVGGAGQRADAVDYLFAEVEPSDLFGRVWRDFNNDGEINFGESDIEDVEVTLFGTDDRGNTVNMTAATKGNTGFAFTNLRPGDYAIEETQPTGFEDGLESLGEVTNPHPANQSAIANGNANENDRFAAIKLKPGSIGDYYNFGELPQASETVPDGSTASIGFWHNKNGQALISKLSDTAGENSTQLGDWLAATFPRMYGDGAYYDAARGQDRTMDLAGKSDEYVADTFGYLHQRNKKSMIENGGVPKVDAQVLALALSTYATSEDLAGTVAQNYGFSTSADGISYSTFRVLDVLTVEEAKQLGLSEADGTLDSQGYSTIIDILSATDAKSTLGLLYDHDQDVSDGDEGGDTEIDSFERTLRILANELYTAINEQYDI